MKQDRKSARMAQIEEAAYALIAEKGYAGTSMLGIAKRAKASNETLYNWYGDKLGLFRAMVDRNAATVRTSLEEANTDGCDPLDTLERAGVVLLGMLTGARAVALNRAAAADPSGTLGAALAQTGRQAVAPRIADTLAAARQAGQLDFADATEAAELYIRLLAGDLQIRRVTGQIAQPSNAEIRARARQAVEMMALLYPGN